MAMLYAADEKSDKNALNAAKFAALLDDNSNVARAIKNDSGFLKALDLCVKDIENGNK